MRAIRFLLPPIDSASLTATDFVRTPGEATMNPIKWISAAMFAAAFIILPISAAELPKADAVKTVMLFKVPAYCEGVVFDREGNGYISWDKTIEEFSLDGKHHSWARPGANGHKILADGTHLVCDASRHAVLHLKRRRQNARSSLKSMRWQTAPWTQRSLTRYRQRRLLLHRSRGQ